MYKKKTRKCPDCRKNSMRLTLGEKYWYCYLCMRTILYKKDKK